MTQVAMPDRTETQLRGRQMEMALFVLGSAAAYAATGVLMKYWGILPPVVMAVLIALVFGCATWCQIEALKHGHLTLIYLAILGIEACLIAAASSFLIGEQISLRELTGGAIIIAGLAVAFS